MLEAPERHPAIPEAAQWSVEHEAWELCPLDDFRRKHGAYQSFRVDGSAWLSCRYEAGVRSGPFRVQHPNGELAREGQFVAGAPHGVMRSYRSETPSPEGLRACCVPTAAHASSPSTIGDSCSPSASSTRRAGACSRTGASPQRARRRSRQAPNTTRQANAG
ncbi:MAG: hypothetical protein QM756_15855 [Polyangiaceae bacterium]